MKASVCLLMSFSLGFSIVVICIALLSFFNMYSVKHTWYILLFFSVLCLIFKWKSILRLIKGYLVPTEASLHRNIFISFLQISTFIQVARVGLQGDYDGLWYGLRSSVVLAPSSAGIFEDLGLVGFTYLYPKGFEIILLPLTRFSSWSYQFLFNHWLVIGCVLVAWYFIKDIANKNVAYIITPLVATLPSLLSMAMTVKPDVITLLFQLSGIYIMYCSYKEKKGQYMYMSIMLLIISYCFKITALLFTSALLVAVIPFMYWKEKNKSLKDLAFIVIGFLTVAIVWGRTLFLTGSPLIVYVGSVLKQLGIELKYPYAINDALYSVPTAQESIIEKVCHNLYGYFIMPLGAEFSHVIIAWGTAIPLVLGVLATMLFVFSKVEKDRYKKWLWFISVLLVTFIVGLLLVGQADGNYFLLFYVIFIIVAGSYLLQREKKYTMIIYISIIFNLLIATCFNWSWTQGYTKIKFINKGYISQQKKYIRAFKQNDGKNIYSILNEEGGKVIAMTWDIGKMVSMKNPSQVWFDIERGNVNLLRSMDDLYQYLSQCGFTHIYIDKNLVTAESSQKIYIDGLIMMGAVDEIVYGKNSAVLVLNSIRVDGNYQAMLQECSEFISEVADE